MSRLNKAIKKSSKKAPIRIHRGSGNVFADLGLSDPDERLAKAELAGRICMLIESERLSQTEAARRLGIDQPKVSMLMRGRLKDFSMERLMHFLVMLGQDVVIGVRDPRDRRHPSMRGPRRSVIHAPKVVNATTPKKCAVAVSAADQERAI